MEYLINKLFPEDQSKAFKKLWNNDPNSRNILEQEIAKELIKTENIILEMPLHQLMFIMSLSKFANCSDECYEVAEIIYWGIRQKNIIPLITEHHGKELANRCLITLGLFKKHMFSRWQRRAAPHPDFIRGVGIATYHKLGQDQIGDHFLQWELFLAEMLAT